MHILNALIFMTYGMLLMVGMLAIPYFIIMKLTGGLARSTVKTTRKIFRH